MFHEKPSTFWVPISRFEVPSFGHNGFALQLENLVSVKFSDDEYFVDSFKIFDSFNVNIARIANAVTITLYSKVTM